MSQFECGDSPGVFARQAQIGGALNARGIQVHAHSRYPTINLDGADVRGVVAFDGGHLQNAAGPLISANQMNAHGGLSVGDEFVGLSSTHKPAISMNGLTSNGLVIVRKATIANDRGTAIRAIGLKLAQNLVVEKDVQVEASGSNGAIRLNQSSIDGMVSFEQVRIINMSGPAISIDGSKIGGGGQFSKMRLLSVGAEGAIAFKSCEIGLQWEFSHLTVICAKGPALAFDQTRVATSLHVDDLRIKGFAVGEALVRVPGVRVGGQMTISGQINNRSGPAIRADGLRVAGSLRISHLRAWCSDDRVAIGFASLQVDGQVDLEDCKVRNLNGRGVSFQSANIANNLTVGNCSIEGKFETFRLYGTQIRDSLVLTSTTICASGQDQIAILMQATDVGGVLRMDVDRILEGGPNERVCVDLDELRYGSLPLRSTDPEKWLELLKDHTRDYSPQPYEHLADVYRKAGQREFARSVLVAQEAERSRRSLSGGRWIWNEVKGRVIGYGYYPMRALAYIAGIWMIAVLAIILGGTAFGVIDNQAVSGPSDCSVLAQLSFSTEVAIPLIGTGFRLQSCGVDTSTAIGQWMLVILGMIRILGWFFAALFVAGFTGLVKKE